MTVPELAVFTPEELRQIRRVTLQAGRRVDALFAGGYRSAFRGQGMEFEEVRPYVPGDDVRRIDWNVTARAQQPHVKLFREERELTLVLALDVSASMRFGSGGRDGRTDKRLQQARVAGALALAAARSNDRVGLLVFTDQVERVVPPRKSRGHTLRVVREVFEPRPARLGTRVEVALDHLRRMLTRRAVVVLLSDFLGPPRFRDALTALCGRHRVHALVLHDRLERCPPGVGLVRVVDAETGRPRLWDLGAVQEVSQVKARVELLRRCGASASALGTDDDAFAVLEQHFRRVGGGR